MAGKDHQQVGLVLMLFGIPVPLREDHPGKATLARGTYLQLGDYHGLLVAVNPSLIDYLIGKF